MFSIAHHECITSTDDGWTFAAPNSPRPRTAQQSQTDAGVTGRTRMDPELHAR
ncbi:hypothetical protein ACFYXL_22320 [Streptomyces tsukubensis]|uniref:hypothetical protein n=1 Tax=Streptomyces tsukubensis TaxID=83656 RepID=UPI00369DF36F